MTKMRSTQTAGPSMASAAQTSDNYTITHQARFDNEDCLDHDIEDREEARDAIVSSLLQILEQPLTLLQKGVISDEQMQFESRLIPGSSLGKHLRHVHDHYRILLDSLEAEDATLPDKSSARIQLDYDKRMRVLPLETSTKNAIEEFRRTQNRVTTLLGAKSRRSQADDLDRAVSLSATTPAQVRFSTTLGREMWFVCLHSIHHYALARVIMVHELGIEMDDSFGVAPSTMVMRKWRQQADSKL